MGARIDQLYASSPGSLFVPLTFRLALHLEQLTWREFLADPNLASFALRSASGLFQTKVFINWFDDWMEAESADIEVSRDDLGQAQRVPGSYLKSIAVADVLKNDPCKTVLDVTKRLCAEVGDNTAVLGYVTGGATLLARLYGDEDAGAIVKAITAGKLSAAQKKKLDSVVQLSSALINEYCERGSGGIVLVEHDPVSSFGYLKAFDSVFNLAQYFGVPVLILVRSPLTAGMIAAAQALGAAWAIGTGAAQPGASVITQLAVGAGPEALGAEFGEKGLYITEWDLAADTDPAMVSAFSDHFMKH